MFVYLSFDVVFEDKTLDDLFKDGTCHLCEKPVAKTAYGALDNEALITISGVYGSFVDGQASTLLCHECAHKLAIFLKVDPSRWHTHSSFSGQHPDHH